MAIIPQSQYSAANPEFRKSLRLYERELSQMSTIEYLQQPYDTLVDAEFFHFIKNPTLERVVVIPSTDELAESSEIHHQEILIDTAVAILETSDLRTWDDNALLQALHILESAKYFFGHENNQVRLALGALKARIFVESQWPVPGNRGLEDTQASFSRAEEASQWFVDLCTKATDHVDKLLRVTPEKSFYGKRARFNMFSGTVLLGKIVGWSSWQDAYDPGNLAKYKGRGIFVRFENEDWGGSTQARADRITILSEL